MKINIHLGARTKASSHEIVKLEAQVNYTLVHFVDGRQLLTATTLGVLEERLSSYGFFRANRSELINLAYLAHFKIHSFGTKRQKNISQSQHIYLSRRREAAFMACVNV